MSPSSSRWLIAILAFGIVLVVIGVLRRGPTPITARAPLFEETDVEAGLRTTVWRRAGGREFEIRVQSSEGEPAPDVVRPATGRVVAFLDRNEDGVYEPDDDQIFGELALTRGAPDQPDLLLHGLLEVPVVWHETDTLSFEIELFDPADVEIAAFSFRIPGSTR